MSRRVLITGGRGYLGGRIAVGLQDEAECFVRLGSRTKRNNPKWLRYGEMVAMDFNSEKSLDEACHGIKVIIHLAALNHIDCSHNSEKAFHVNVLGTMKLLEAAKRAGVDKFIYVSTAHIYGSPLEGKISENSLPRPVHSYSLTHKMAEDCVLAANDNGHVQGMVVRLSNGFGYPVDTDANCWSLLVNDLCRQAVINRSLQLRSAGLQRRDFVTLKDVQGAVLHMMKMGEHEVGSGVFNVGGNWAPRIVDIARRIQERCSVVLGYKPDLIVPEPSGDEVESELQYSIDKLLATGFTLVGQVDDEIDKLLLICRQNFGANKQ